MAYSGVRNRLWRKRGKLIEPLLIFLDFDGVLHPFSDRHIRRYCDLPKFERVLRLSDEARIVITSSLREDRPLSELRGIFSTDIQPRVIGRTPILAIDSASDLTGSRYREIQCYLYDHPARRWIALDDDATLFPPECPNLIVCDCGFSDVVAQRLKRMLIGNPR